MFLECLDGVGRVIAEITVNQDAEAVFRQQALQVPYCVSAGAFFEDGAVIGNSWSAKPKALGLAQIVDAVGKAVVSAVDGARNRFDIVAIGMAVDASAPPIGNGRHQGPRKVFQLLGVSFKVRCIGYQLSNILCRQLVIGPSGCLDQTAAAIPDTIAFFDIAKIFASFVGRTGSEFEGRSEVSTFVGKLRDEVAQSQWCIDTAVDDKSLMFNNSFYYAAFRAGGDLANVCFGNLNGHDYPPINTKRYSIMFRDSPFEILSRR